MRSFQVMIHEIVSMRDYSISYEIHSFYLLEECSHGLRACHYFSKNVLTQSEPLEQDLQLFNNELFHLLLGFIIFTLNIKLP